AQVTTSVARGDLTQKITVDARGEVAELKNTINTMVDQLSAFADEVTRVARDVGTEGRLGGQARVQGVSGTWKDLTENVNSMAGNLTDQVRNIAQVTTGVARGDLSKKITVPARGEILELKDTINTMVDQLSAFADEVTRVAREVGTEGRLGGQARVEGASGTWQDLTHNVNQLASNLTTQVRAIGEVSTAVAQGDLTRQIAVDAAGEVAELKDNVNQMIANLRETTRKNAEQDWLKSNLARISGLMQGQRNLDTVCQLIMSEVTPLVGAHRGAMYVVEHAVGGEQAFRLISGYALPEPAAQSMPRFVFGQGLVGQAALERRPVVVSQAPEGYLPVVSGLGSAPPAQLVVLPVLFEDEVLAVIELASFGTFSASQHSFLDEFIETVGIVLNTISANVRTEDLLAQSQLLTSELQDTNEELAAKARLLEMQNRDIEVKNEEIEAAQVTLQERAEQLALSSRYKSEFLANMSHELRNPLNSLLILARLLSEDTDSNLTPKQIDYARTIHGAGSDLLALINDILDLSKIEAGKMQLHPTWMSVRDVVDEVVRSYKATAEQKGLTLEVDVTGSAPVEILTDDQRLQQILRNLLSNAIKFTEEGGVRMVVSRAAPDVELSGAQLVGASSRVVQFNVVDTGIGVGPEKLRLIFEAFQQADGTTSRRYGGTGLGLSISREITGLLGGELRVRSTIGEGSTFTLYVPEKAVFDGAEDIVSGPVTPWADVAAEQGNALGPGVPISLQDIDAHLGAGRRAGQLAELGRGPTDQLAAGTEELLVNSVATLTPDIRSRAQEVPARWDGPDPALARQRALIVDDDVRNVFAVSAALEAQGMVVRYAENGRDGLRALEDDAGIDVVLMDIMMPGMDGYETIRAIRAVPRFARLPVIALTAKALTGDREKALESGASAYVTKPADIDALLDLIRRHVAPAPERGTPPTVAATPDAGLGDERP
ncbi:MAG: response regulator, partial [Acidimicrobiia bacterium]|nr:response regulator [Acidimicrobiia bacterium]